MKDSTGEDRVASAYYREVGLYETPTPAAEKEGFTEYTELKELARARLYAETYPDRPLGKTYATRLPAAKAATLLGTEFKALENRVRQDKTVLRQKHKLACWYLKFVIGRAGHRTKNPDLVSELIAEGNIGLMLAIDKFEVERGFRFLTLGAWWIDSTMREHLNRIGGVHMPSHARKRYRKQRQEEDKLIAQGKMTDYTMQEPVVSSIDSAVVASEDDTESSAMTSEFNAMAHLAACGLSRREMVIMIYYYALRGGEPCTFRDLARLLHRFDGVKITSERVRQVKERAAKALQTHLAAQGITSVSDVY